MEAVGTLASTNFSYDPRADNYRLNCKDGLLVMARKTQIVRGGDNPNIPLLVLSVDHPLKGEMMKEIQSRQSAKP